MDVDCESGKFLGNRASTHVFLFERWSFGDRNSDRIRVDPSKFTARNLEQVFSDDGVFGPTGRDDVAGKGRAVVRAYFKARVGF